jgi:hypothetical protein
MTPETVLVRRRDLEIRIGDADDVVIGKGEDAVSSPHALVILDAFAHPRTIAGFLETAAASPEHWIELSSSVVQLARAGVLVKPGASEAPPRGFAQPAIHIVMLEDQRRTHGFIRALQALTTKDDVVVDIGTGTGILATSAALAGARRVHAVESSAIADAAEKVFEANGVADRVHLVRGRSTHVTLPERGDLLVTETIGNDPLAEHLLEIVHDAKARLLTPSARLIPSAIELLLVPVEVPGEVFERHVFTQERIASWRASYGVDLSPLMTVRRASNQPMNVRTDELRAWGRVGSPVSLLTIDLTQPFEVHLRRRVSFVLEQDVARLGVLIAFRATLAPGIVVSTLDDQVDPRNSWRYALWPSLERPSFARGESAVVDYAYDRGVTSITVS